jgi:hypothetical protein
MYWYYLFYLADSLLPAIACTHWACKLITRNLTTCLDSYAHLRWLIVYCYRTQNAGQNLYKWGEIHFPKKYFLTEVSYFTKSIVTWPYPSEVHTSLCHCSVKFANIFCGAQQILCLAKISESFNESALQFQWQERRLLNSIQSNTYGILKVTCVSSFDVGVGKS